MNNLASSIDFRLVFDAFITKWRALAVAIILTPILGLAANYATLASYRSQATILIQNSVVASPYLNEISTQWEINTRLPVVQTVVESRAVGERILRELGELPDDASPAARDWMIRDFQQRVTVTPYPGGVIEIRFESPVPENAQRGIQLLMETVREEIIRPQRDSLDAEVSFLEDQTQRVAREIEADELRIREFREANAGATPELLRSNIELYSQLRNQFESAQSELASQEQQLRVARERLLAYDPQVQRIGDQIESVQTELRSLRRTYADGHPSVEAAASQLARLEAQREARVHGESALNINDFERLLRSGSIRSTEILNAELTTYRNAVSNTEGLRERVDSLRGRLAEIDESLQSLTGNEERLAAMTQTLETRRSHFQRLLLQYEESIISRELTLQEQNRQVWVIEAPEIPSKSDRLPYRLVLFAGLFGGFVVGVMVIGFSEFIDRTVRVPREAEEIAGVPTIASLPPLDG
jgi:uncharacterized protein involved in exopolysaccharide biosynthesis